MSFEVGRLQLLNLFEALTPLVPHLTLEIFADLKVVDFLFEPFLNEDLVNVLKMEQMRLSLICLDLVGLQNFQDVFLLYDDHLILIHIKRIFIVHSILLQLELFLATSLA